MSKPKDAKAKWNATFADYVNISDLRTGVRRAPQHNPCVQGLRSVCWKAFLLYGNIDRKTWPKLTRDSRGAYASLKEHLLHDLKAPEEGPATVDPLAEAGTSRWDTMKADETLRGEILQDVERCMPEISLFRQPNIREMLVNILFVYCKINADLGYRQGMHELLAPFVWVLHEDASILQSSERKPKDEVITETLDISYIEHDAFTLFCIIMQTAKAFYETVSATKSPGGAQESPIVERSRRIHEEYLAQTDPELASHLTSIDVLPQIFVIRWIRLLFGREFPFAAVLALWDMIFAEDPALTLVDHVCLAMLLRLRWQLLEADYSTALALLLRYPEPAGGAPQTAALVADAVYLGRHMDLQGGSTVIRRYTNRSPLVALAQAGGDPVKRRGAHAAAGSLDFNKTFAPLRSPAEYLHNQGGLEAIFQGAAKNVYSRSEQWGLNKAIRGAVQNLQNNTLSPGRNQQQQQHGGSTWSLDKGKAVPNSEALESEVKDLRNRNQQLAGMLVDAIGELTQQSKALEDKKDETSATALTLTVAKLQYLQVHLADSQLPLDPIDADHKADQRPGDEDIPSRKKSPPPSPTPAPRIRLSSAARTSEDEAKDVPSNNTLQADTQIERTGTPTGASSMLTPEPKPGTPRQPGNFAQPRPSLAESSYSWMLGEDRSTTSSFTAAAVATPGHDREEQVRKKSAARSRAGFLFGDKDKDGENKAVSSAATGSPSRRRRGSTDRRKDEDEDGFTMGALRGGSDVGSGPL